MTSLYRIRDFAARFRKDEDGGIIIFTLFMFILMLMIGGMAVDLMRYETARSQLQNTLDRAVLAAADLDQQNAPAVVLSDYFEAAGLETYLDLNHNIQTGVNFKTVGTNATIQLPTMFMNMMGITRLDAPAMGTATESVEEIEISLILDVSGSMNWSSASGSSKLSELQAAATEFVDLMFERANPNELSISIVPYSTQVNLPANMADLYNLDRAHDYSSCVNFEPAQFGSTSIPQSMELVHTNHFDPWYNNGQFRYTSSTRLYVCRPEPNVQVLPLSGDPNALKSHINGLTAGGNTSIDVGIKWGAALLDPSSQPVVTNLISQGDINSHFAGRPFDFNTGQSLKIIIVMTDGVNTSQYYLDDSLRGAMSNAYQNPSNGHIWIDSNENGNRDGDGQWNERWYYPRGDYYNWNNYWRQNGSQPSGMTHLSFADLMNIVTLKYNAQFFQQQQHNSSAAYNAAYHHVLNSVGGSTKDQRMDQICDAAKAPSRNMIVYTIGFEVTDASAQVMESCASSPAHFYRVAGPEIMDAFRAIARQVNELRLIQ